MSVSNVLSFLFPLKSTASIRALPAPVAEAEIIGASTVRAIAELSGDASGSLDEAAEDLSVIQGNLHARRKLNMGLSNQNDIQAIRDNLVRAKNRAITCASTLEAMVQEIDRIR